MTEISTHLVRDSLADAPSLCGIPRLTIVTCQVDWYLRHREATGYCGACTSDPLVALHELAATDLDGTRGFEKPLNPQFEDTWLAPQRDGSVHGWIWMGRWAGWQVLMTWDGMTPAEQQIIRDRYLTRCKEEGWCP